MVLMIHWVSLLELQWVLKSEVVVVSMCEFVWVLKSVCEQCRMLLYTTEKVKNLGVRSFSTEEMVSASV